MVARKVDVPVNGPVTTLAVFTRVNSSNLRSLVAIQTSGAEDFAWAKLPLSGPVNALAQATDPASGLRMLYVGGNSFRADADTGGLCGDFNPNLNGPV